MDVDFSAFEHIALFVRGEAYQTRTRRRWQNLWRLEEAEVPIYRRLVLIMKMRHHERLGPEADTEHVFLKVFKDIPRMDVDMLLPGARVRLTKVDRGKIVYPVLSGLALTVYNIFSELVHWVHTLMMSNSAAWALTAGCIGYGYKSYYGYQQTKQRYHLSLTQSLYFQNLDSNAGVLHRLFDEAEEQDCRTAILAYFCLWRYAPSGATTEDLDALMELYLDRHADVPLLCEPGEAVVKLKKLGLVELAGDRYRVLPPARALEAIASSPLAAC
jgi:hypothetical protein